MSAVLYIGRRRLSKHGLDAATLLLLNSDCKEAMHYLYWAYRNDKFREGISG